MQNIFRVIRKKRNLRRLSAVWLFLVMIELFCPALCGMQTCAAEVDFSPNETTFSNNRKTNSSETLVSDRQNQNQEQTVCTDECLCHATAIPNLGDIPRKGSSIRSELIVFNFTEPVLSSLPPPDQPPKIS